MDIGAHIGDSACAFVENLEFKQILSYEPHDNNYKFLCSFVSENSLQDKIIPIKKGIGDQKMSLSMSGSTADESKRCPGARFIGNDNSDADLIEITTIDEEVKQRGLEVGFIQMDIEGFESKAINGALGTIEEQKPILMISMYHNPKDFFEIKPLLESLGLGYRFMIRRDAYIVPLASINLIAY